MKASGVIALLQEMMEIKGDAEVAFHRVEMPGKVGVMTAVTEDLEPYINLLIGPTAAL